MAQEAALRPLTIKAFPFADEGVVDPVDLMVDDQGYLWILDQRSSYCLIDDRPVRVHDLTGTDQVLGWEGRSETALIVRTANGTQELPMDLVPGKASKAVVRNTSVQHRLTLPGGEQVHLTNTNTLVLTLGGDTLVQPLADERHGPVFVMEPGRVGRLLYDPGNGIWLLGENGLLLASPLEPVFHITEVPGTPGKVTQVRFDRRRDRVTVLSHTRGAYVQEESTGRPLQHVANDQQDNPIGGVKWWTVRGHHYIHGAHYVQEVDLATGAVNTVLDLRNVVPKGGSTRINNFEADEACRFLYIGTQDNLLVVFDPGTGRAGVRQLMPEGSYSGINLVYESALFSNDRAVVITEHDLFLVDGMDGPVRRAREEWPSFRFGPRFRPSSVRVVGDTLVAIASFANGMYLYHVAKDSLYRPLGTDVERMEMVDLFHDDAGIIHGTCNDGLLVYNIADNTCRMVRKEHGLPMENLRYRYMSVIAPGEMALGLTDRFTTFRSADLMGDLGKVHIEGLEINGKRIRTAPHLPMGAPLALGPQENNIAFTLGTPYQLARPLTAFAVRLAEAPEEVRFLQDHEEVRFFNLGPGEHVVQVALGPAGPFTDLLALDIAQPLWKRGWFIALIIALVLTILLVLFALRLKHVREEASMKAAYDARIAQLELSSLRAQMHPHFIFNSLNSIKSFIAGNEPRTATRYLNKFSQLIRSILNNSRHTRVDLRTELRTLELYIELEQMRFEKSFELTIAVDPDIDQDETTLPPMILQPYAENAIWHGLMHKEGERRLEILVTRRGDTLQVTVRDNGIGRAAAQALKSKTATKHRSQGMAITAEIIERTRSGGNAGVVIHDLVDDQGAPAGTEVIITVPNTTNP